MEGDLQGRIQFLKAIHDNPGFMNRCIVLLKEWVPNFVGNFLHSLWKVFL